MDIYAYTKNHTPILIFEAAIVLSWCPASRKLKVQKTHLVYTSYTEVRALEGRLIQKRSKVFRSNLVEICSFIAPRNQVQEKFIVRSLEILKWTLPAGSLGRSRTKVKQVINTNQIKRMFAFRATREIERHKYLTDNSTTRMRSYFEHNRQRWALRSKVCYVLCLQL